MSLVDIVFLVLNRCCVIPFESDSQSENCFIYKTWRLSVRHQPAEVLHLIYIPFIVNGEKLNALTYFRCLPSNRVASPKVLTTAVKGSCDDSLRQGFQHCQCLRLGETSPAHSYVGIALMNHNHREFSSIFRDGRNPMVLVSWQYLNGKWMKLNSVVFWNCFFKFSLAWNFLGFHFFGECNCDVLLWAFWKVPFKPIFQALETKTDLRQKRGLFLVEICNDPFWTLKFYSRWNSH